MLGLLMINLMIYHILFQTKWICLHFNHH